MQPVSSYLNNEAKNNLSVMSFRLLDKETPGTSQENLIINENRNKPEQ